MNKIKDSGIGDKIIELWKHGYSGDRIAELTGSVVTGRSVLRFLNREGVATHDSRRLVKCENCGKEFKKVRNLWRKSKHHFCKKECYWEYLKNPAYSRSIYHSRQARKVVRSLGYLPSPEEPVHHEDYDTTNNDPGNLMVFASNEDHTRWHKMGEERSGVIPVWPPSKVAWVKGVLGEKGVEPKKIHRTVCDAEGVKWPKCSSCGKDMKKDGMRMNLPVGVVACSAKCHYKLKPRGVGDDVVKDLIKKGIVVPA